MLRLSVLFVLLAASVPAAAQRPLDTVYTRADTLRGSNGPARAWWDASFYDLHVLVNPADSSVRGWNGITYKVLKPAQDMQIDLQTPLVADSIIQDRKKLASRRDGNAFFVTLKAVQRVGETKTVTVYYHGQPGHDRPRNPGFTWAHDSLGNLWIATSNELTGASIWWPLKDYAGDEPDSQRIAITVPDPLIDVSNGRLRSTTHHADQTTTYEWFVADPINTYDVAVNAGLYTHFSDTLQGEGGTLSLDFWPIAYHTDTARGQWKQATPMLQCFEHWYGPYAWYKDGYKLIEQSYLGMEHQSGIAYGNKFMKGYLGRDLSGTGLGLSWDYIVIHESAHEWWGNNVSTNDAGDLWIHESLATYSEGIYTECQKGKTAGEAYIIGLRKAISNRYPIQGPHGVVGWYHNDIYMKGANVFNTLRQVVDDDARWRDILRGIQKTFWHQTVSGHQVETYIAQQAGIDLSRFFDQYLRTTKVPEFDYKVDGTTLSYRWSNVVPGFDMPIRVEIPGSGTHLLKPTEEWQTVPVASGGQPTVDENFYVTAKAQ
ncbi:MAG TPA: M1 family metallopeptidase [Gemmatimonadales bacterium]|nr:M1 family metallopeptidase [Gemmatimonadales bacterium]